MPEIQVKDKLTTLEELGTVYNNTVKKSGDTMTGPLQWESAAALSAAIDLQYFLGIDPFADGGTTHYITGANLLTAIGAVSTSAVINVAHGGTGATTGNGACENINAVNSKTDTARRISSGSVNDAALGMVSYNGASSTVTDKPYNNWFDVFTFKSVETNYTRQIAVPWFNNRSIAFRVQSNGTWGSWRYIATQTTEPTA